MRAGIDLSFFQSRVIWVNYGGLNVHTVIKFLMSSALIASLARDPRVRGLARQVAQGVVTGIKRRRSSRRSRGRWVAGQRILGFGPGPVQSRRRNRRRGNGNNSMVNTTVSQPVREATITTIQPKVNMLHSDTEQWYTVVRPADGAITKVIVPCFPDNFTMFPRGAAIARNYTTYQVRSLTYVFVPAVGTQINGRVAMAFSPRVDIDAATEFGSIEEVQALPGAVSGSLTQKSLMPVLPTSLNKTGQDLYIDVNMTADGGSTTQPLLYQTGTFILVVEGTQAASAPTNLGVVNVIYTFNLKTPIINKSATATAFETVGGQITDTAGSAKYFGLKNLDAGLSIVRRMPVTLIMRSVTASAVTLSVNSVLQTPVYSETVETTYTLDVFHFPLGFRISDVVTVGGSGAAFFAMFDCPASVVEMLFDL